MKVGGQHSPETRARIAASLSGRTHLAETRAKMRAAKVGRPGGFSGRAHSIETRVSASLARRPPDLSAAELGDYRLLLRSGYRSAEALAALGTGRVGERPFRRFRIADCTPLQQAILLFLRGATATRPRTKREIADAVYGDREDGGPEWADSVIATTIWDLRRRLRGTPVAVRSRLGEPGGYWLGGPAAGESA